MDIEIFFLNVAASSDVISLNSIGIYLYWMQFKVKLVSTNLTQIKLDRLFAENSHWGWLVSQVIIFF